MKYVKDMNLNAVRLEGKIVSDHFLELADQQGILIMAGWTCCSHWEQWEKWDDEDHVISAESLKDQIWRLRSHPSVFNWMNGSDGPPPPDVKQRYVAILKQLNWPNPYESSAMAKPTTVTGDTGVQMTGPYEYVAPSYWLLDKDTAARTASTPKPARVRPCLRSTAWFACFPPTIYGRWTPFGITTPAAAHSSTSMSLPKP